MACLNHGRVSAPASPTGRIRPSPVAADDRIGRNRASGAGARQSGEQGLVMLCVRVSPSLRRRLKLAAASSGRPVQALATDAFEAICRQHDM